MDALNRRLAVRRRAGTSMVEMVFVLPVLLLLMFGLADFSLVFHDYLAAMNAARAGVREATLSRVGCNPNGLDSPENRGIALVTEMLEANGVKGFSTPKFSIATPSTNLCQPGYVQVEFLVKSEHRLLTGFFNDPVNFPGIEFTVKAGAMSENGF
jgi:hypothetical protein